MTLAQPRRLSLLVWAAATIASMCLLAAAYFATRSEPPSAISLTAAFVLILASARLHIPIRLGAQRLDLAWGEAGLVIALAIAPSAWIILLTAPAVLLCYVGRQAAIKTVYNVANYTIAASASAAVVTVAGVKVDGGLIPIVDGSELVALIAAGAVGGVVTYLAVAAVIAVAQNTSPLATWHESGGLQVLTLSGNLGVAGFALFVVRYDPTAVLAVPIIGAFLHQRYAGRLRAYEEREAGRRKSVAVGQLTADLDEPGVARRTAHEAAVLTSADVVEVELSPTDGQLASLYRYHRSSGPWTGNPSNAPRLDARLVARVPIAAEARAMGGEIRVWLEAGATEVRLSGPDFEAVELLAATAAAALSNARAHAKQTLLATTDRTSGLPIRTMLLEAIESSVREASGTALPSVALILVDITGFRGVVRTLGHDAAEALLARVGQQLREARLEGEFLAAVGGDDFGIYLSSAGDPAHVRRRALTLLDSVVAPFELAVGTVTLDAVAGIAYSPTPVARGSDLLRQATVALEEARQRDLRVEFYDPALDILGPAAVVMESELRDALTLGHELEMQYQPVVHLPSEQPLAIEALARWKHPTKGMLLAGEFMPVLERSRDHARFVSWTLEQAVGMRTLWSQDRDLPISINLAGRCLLDTSLPREVAAVLASSNVTPNQLMLEFSESTTLTGSATAALVLGELRKLGVRIAIDGFGLGQSSWTGLLEVPATDVKIGSRLVADMLTDDHAAAIVQLAIEFAKHADLRVIALGVPAVEHVDALVAAGCEAAQGMVLAGPMWARELKEYLIEAPAAPPQVEAEVIDLALHRRAARQK